MKQNIKTVHISFSFTILFYLILLLRHYHITKNY